MYCLFVSECMLLNQEIFHKSCVILFLKNRVHEDLHYQTILKAANIMEKTHA